MGNAAGSANAETSALLTVEKQGAVLTVGLNRPAKRTIAIADAIEKMGS